jgi:hypothetical protein
MQHNTKVVMLVPRKTIIKWASLNYTYEYSSHPKINRKDEITLLIKVK